MKLGILLAALAVVATPLAALADGTDGGQCTDATIRGDYAFRVSGRFMMQGNWVDRQGIAMTHFDGQGGLSQEDWVMSNGAPLAGPTDPVSGFHDNENGTYTVNPDCTGAAEIDMRPAGPDVKIYFVIAASGRILHMIVRELTPPGAPGPVPVSIHSDGERLGRIGD